MQLASRKSGGCHSAKYLPRLFTWSTAEYIAGPTGVSAAATAESGGIAASRSHWRRGTARSRAMPSTATKPMMIPIDHMPWTITHSHVSGTSHQRARPSSRVRIQAYVVSAMNT